jgi:hypothetical protein
LIRRTLRPDTLRMRTPISIFVVVCLVTIFAVDVPGIVARFPFAGWFSQASGIGVRRPLFRTAPGPAAAYAHFSDGVDVSLFELIGPLRQELVDFRWPRIVSRLNADSSDAEWMLVCHRFAEARPPNVLDDVRVRGVAHRCRQ